jgi:hypothetical protein
MAEDAFDAFEARRGLEAGGEQAHDFAGFAGFAKAKRLLGHGLKLQRHLLQIRQRQAHAEGLPYLESWHRLLRDRRRGSGVLRRRPGRQWRWQGPPAMHAAP